MKHILISEADALFADDLADVFELKGHKVTLTRNGAEAISHLQVITFDLVITNLFSSHSKYGFHLIGKILEVSVID